MPTQRRQEAPSEPAQAEPKTTGRLESLDICRGVAILAVLFIHVSGHFLPALHPIKSHTTPGSAWYALAVLNVDSLWAVPCFLMLSAFANALSLSRTPDLTRYAKRRLQTAVVPYVIWSGVYMALNFALGTLHHLTLDHTAKLLLTGTAEFHLYFFVLVIELYVLLPLLLPVFQRRPPLWAALLGAVALQAIIYGLNKFVLPHKFQATILWDILPVALGLWLWSQMGRWPELFRRGLWPALAVTLAALALYTPLGVATSAPLAPSSLAVYHQLGKQFTAVYQGGEWVFTAGMSFLVLVGAGALVRSRAAGALSYLGAESLAIYVMHPLAIIALDKLGAKALGVGAGIYVYYALCLGLPLAAVRVWHLRRAPLGGLGRDSGAPK